MSSAKQKLAEEFEPTPTYAIGPRLMELEARLARLAGVNAEISERLQFVEKTTTETNNTIRSLMVAIKRHPLLSKFLGG